MLLIYMNYQIKKAPFGASLLKIMYKMLNSHILYHFFRNLFTKYCCPLPVTLGVFEIVILPSE